MVVRARCRVGGFGAFDAHLAFCELDATGSQDWPVLLWDVDAAGKQVVTTLREDDQLWDMGKAGDAGHRTRFDLGESHIRR